MKENGINLKLRLIEKEQNKSYLIRSESLDTSDTNNSKTNFDPKYQIIKNNKISFEEMQNKNLYNFKYPILIINPGFENESELSNEKVSIGIIN